MEIDWEKQLGRKRCCEEDFGGSHYHCGHCGEVSGMYGHFVMFNKLSSKKLAENLGLPFPFVGFRCDPTTNDADNPLYTVKR